MLKMFRTCFRAIINLQIFFRFFDVISFLSCDFMVFTNMRNMCKKVPRNWVRVIENLQIFLRVFSGISFLSSDFMVLTNIFKIKNVPELMLGPQAYNVFIEFLFFSRDFMVSNICVRTFPKLVLVAYHKFQELMIKKLRSYYFFVFEIIVESVNLTQMSK